MAITRAIFKKMGNQTVLVCNACGKVIKLERDFGPDDIFAAKGVTSMVAQYCDDHKSLNTYESKQEIKKLLRESIMRKNILDVVITRPHQKLIIMRGIPGSGKSTRANDLVGEGIIHSTDAIIEATGDYSGYFQRMVESKDWSEHGRTHNKNFKNARQSMIEGVSPVIVDNTNIKAYEPKKYVEAALRMGLDENNISIVDVGNGGVSATVLAERNTHNVPLETIRRMMSSHKGVGKLTVKKILESKGGPDKSAPKVLYSGVILDDSSKSKLLAQFASKIPAGWKTFAHHMTTSFAKPLANEDDLGKEVELTVIELGVSDKALAVKVEGYPTDNEIPHITIAVNVDEGGKPYDSNKITDWGRVDLGETLKVYGTLKNVTA